MSGIKTKIEQYLNEEKLSKSDIDKFVYHTTTHKWVKKKKPITLTLLPKSGIYLSQGKVLFSQKMGSFSQQDAKLIQDALESTGWKVTFKIAKDSLKLPFVW